MPKTRQNLEKVSQLRMTKEMYDELTQLANEDERHMANMVRILLKEAIFYRQIGMNKRKAKECLDKFDLQESH